MTSPQAQTAAQLAEAKRLVDKLKTWIDLNVGSASIAEILSEDVDRLASLSTLPGVQPVADAMPQIILRSALGELIYLKDMKDSLPLMGRLREFTETEYRRRQPLAWEFARKALALAAPQPAGVQEAVAWVDPATLERVTPGGIVTATLVGKQTNRFTTPLYTSPQPSGVQVEPAAPFGPWHTDEIGAALYASGFEHDLKLSIDGDFLSREERIRCARKLVDHLNTSPAAMADGEQA